MNRRATTPHPPARTFTLLAAACALLVCVGLGMTAARASAVFRELTETGTPGVLVLSVDSATPLWAELGPGDSSRWLVEASLRDAERGDLALELRANGALLLASGLTAGIEACPTSFDLGGPEPACDGEAAVVLAPTPIAGSELEGRRFALAPLLRDAPRQLLVTLTVPASADARALAGTSANVGLGVHAAGDAPSRPTPPAPADPRLPITGGDLEALAVLAAGLLGLGASLILRRRAIRAGAAR